jgi:hypothetical protein
MSSGSIDVTSAAQRYDNHKEDIVGDGINDAVVPDAYPIARTAPHGTS